MAAEGSRGLSQRACWAGGESVVSRLMAQALAHPELISLAAGFVDEKTLPVEPTRRALDALWSDPSRARAALQYGTTIGHLPLREDILNRMIEADGPRNGRPTPTVHQVVITAGSNQLLHLVSDTLLDPGDIVLCGAPSYFVFLGTLCNLGVRTVGIESDSDGLIPEAIEAELARREADGELGRVKAIYATTYYDNPSGVTTPADRRRQMVEIARRWSREGKIYLIEDAAYRELRYYGDDVPSMHSFDPDGDRVIYAGTFSKSYSPGIRVGWGVLPPELVTPLLAQKGNVDFGSPHFSQMLMATVLERGLFDEHLERLRAEYRRKLDATLDAADRWLAPVGGIDWVRPSGGLYLWLRLPEPIDTGLDSPLFHRAVDEGVLYVPGECCYPGQGCPRHKNLLRLSFGVPSIEEIRRGVERLARAIRHVR